MIETPKWLCVLVFQELELLRELFLTGDIEENPRPELAYIAQQLKDVALDIRLPASRTSLLPLAKLVYGWAKYVGRKCKVSDCNLFQTM